MAFGIPEAMKAREWEVAKGHLHALVAMQGSYKASTEYETERWGDLKTKVEEFIEDIEQNGLQE